MSQPLSAFNRHETRNRFEVESLGWFVLNQVLHDETGNKRFTG